MDHSDDDFMDSTSSEPLPPPFKVAHLFSEVDCAHETTHTSPASNNPTQSIMTQVEETEATSSYDTHSGDAQRLMGTFVPRNTLRGSRSSLMVFARFVVRKDQFWPPHIAPIVDTDKENILNEARKIVFPDGRGSFLPGGYTDWNRQQLRRVRFWLIEFVAQYQSTVTGKEVSPSTMKTHMTNVQRGFNVTWNYDLKLLQGEIFADPNTGLVAVMDNTFRTQQAHGAYTVSHNVLTIADLQKLYNSKSFSRDTPAGFLTRMVFNIALVTSMRPSSLVNLKMSQFDRRNVDGDPAWVITGVIGCADGSSKTERGGLKAVGDKPTKVCVWKEDAFDGTLNVFDDIDDYVWIRTQRNVGTDRFFLQVQHKAKDRREFFKAQDLGKNSFMKLVKNACDEEGVVGTGARKWVTTHCLRATVASLLCRAKHPGSSVAMRTGHRAVEKSLQSYQNLMSEEGRQQQRDIFGPSGTSEPVLKRTKLDDVGKENTLGENDASALQSIKNAKKELVQTELSTVLGSVGNLHNSTINVSITFAGSSNGNIPKIENESDN